MTPDSMRSLRESVDKLEDRVSNLDTNFKLHDQRSALIAERLVDVLDRQTEAMEKLTTDLPAAMREAQATPWVKIVMFLAGGIVLAALGSKGLDLLLSQLR